MGINITQTMGGYQFENRENQRNTVREILSKKGSSDEAINRLIDKTIFDSANSRIYSSAQLSVLKAASQISLNGNLKETLKYLKNHNTKKETKTPVLGELWGLFTKEQENYEDIVDFDIDFSAENIFAA